jgi:hypothetical protein
MKVTAKGFYQTNLLRTSMLGVFVLASLTLHAQDSAVLAGNANATLEMNLQAIEQTTPMSANFAPAVGTFFSAQNPNWPPMPGNMSQVPVWSLGDGFFLLDDLVQSQARSAMGMQAMDMSGPTASRWWRYWQRQYWPHYRCRW